MVDVTMLIVQIDALRPGLLGDFRSYGHKFCGGPPIMMNGFIPLYK